MKQRSVALDEIVPISAISKSYTLQNDMETLSQLPWARIAHDGTRVVGVAAIEYEKWNRRARLQHLYVDRAARGQGIGQMLVEAAMVAAHALGARGLWVETQTTNYPAIRFYERAGFNWCGFDTSLYDLDQSVDEIAVFFWRGLPSRPAIADG
jgi:ribosomal protein S18 acetylase RimI-like enzyme